MKCVKLIRTPPPLCKLARIGANLNQLARWANTCKWAAEVMEVLAALAGIKRRIAKFDK